MCERTCIISMLLLLLYHTIMTGCKRVHWAPACRTTVKMRSIVVVHRLIVTVVTSSTIRRWTDRPRWGWRYVKTFFESTAAHCLMLLWVVNHWISHTSPIHYIFTLSPTPAARPTVPPSSEDILERSNARLVERSSDVLKGRYLTWWWEAAIAAALLRWLRISLGLTMFFFYRKEPWSKWGCSFFAVNRRCISENCGDDDSEEGFIRLNFIVLAVVPLPPPTPSLPAAA